MSINVIITFQTKPGNTAAFAALIKQVRQDLPQVDGCLGVRAFQSSSDPCVFTLVETWQAAERHLAHIAGVLASGAWDAIAAHLAADPVSSYYSEL